ncbi:MAG TPA: SCO family protein [bacterium]|jgi:protein SCO1/2|nr:SCO family protein [bacterium]
MKSINWKMILLVVLSIGGLAFLGQRVWKNQTSDHFFNPMDKTPVFSFKDQTGKDFSSDELKGKVWVADFIFTRCAGQCPMLSQWMRVLQQDWKGNADFKLVSFSVDPANDTVSAFRQYADDLQADDNQWHFLTGAKSKIYEVIQKGFHLTAMKDPQGSPGFEFIHTTRLILVDANGMVRGMYDGQDAAEVEKLKKDIRYLMNSRTKS